MKRAILAIAILFLAFNAGAQVSLWSSGTTPGNPGNCADASTELGLRFQSSVAGTISAIRFYKSSSNTGTHVGRLWTSNGTLLSSATFTSETASGWQQVTLPGAVSIAANTIYVVSYSSPNGFYSQDQNFFTTTAYSNGVLTALESSVNGGGGTNGGGNGVYARPGGTFPSRASTYNANAYVDVVFTQTVNVSVTLSWVSVSLASSYNLYRGTVSGGPYALVLNTSGTTASDATVNPGTTYYYILKSVASGVEAQTPSPELIVAVPSH